MNDEIIIFTNKEWDWLYNIYFLNFNSALTKTDICRKIGGLNWTSQTQFFVNNLIKNNILVPKEVITIRNQEYPGYVLNRKKLDILISKTKQYKLTNAVNEKLRIVF